MRIVVLPELSSPRTRMRASLSERLSLRRSVCARVRLVCGRGDGVPGDGNVLSTMYVWVGVLSTAAARRREPHGSEPPAAALAGRAAGRGRGPRPRPRPRGPRPGPGPRRRAGVGAGGRLRRAEPRARAAGRRPHVRGSADELGSAAPRAPRGDSWGRQARWAAPAFDTEGARGAPSFPPGSMVLHANSSPRSARRVGPAGMAAKRCRFVKAGRHPP